MDAPIIPATKMARGLAGTNTGRMSRMKLTRDSLGPSVKASGGATMCSANAREAEMATAYASPSVMKDSGRLRL